MAKAQQLEGKIREGKARSARRQGMVPGVLYGHGLASKSVEVDIKQFTKLLKTAGFSSLVNLKLSDGSTHNVLIRDIQAHPLKGLITHVDFYQVRLDEKIEAKVPLRFTGEASAVKDLGGVLVRNIDELEVTALPTDLPHDIEVDITSLTGFDKVIRVTDIALPEGVALKHEADAVVALVQEPRSEQELEQLAGEVKEDVEAVEGIKKEEPKEGEEAAPAEAEKKE